MRIENLKKYFKMNPEKLFGKPQYLKAVDGVSFEMKRGETFALVGESGCGKSTIGRTITRIYQPDDGIVEFDGKNISNMSEKELNIIRKHMQIIFQDPFSSLNPHMTVEQVLSEPIKAYGKDVGDKGKYIERLLRKVGLSKSDMSRYPTEFSGGQIQRICIARALSISPQFILCDEPTSALDVSIQAQVINLLKDLQDEFGLTYLFISHDLSVVRYISHKVGVMYLGKIVEEAETKDFYDKPMHPYSKALLAAVPKSSPSSDVDESREILSGDVPSPMKLPTGCRFKSRCKYKMEKCDHVEPVLRKLENGHKVACHLYEK